MPIGPGKYDSELTELRKKIGAEGAILIVFKGNRGSGFSAQLPAELTLAIADTLQGVVDQIRSDYADILRDARAFMPSPRAAVDGIRAATICRLGDGAATCRFLARDGIGFICIKKDPTLRDQLDMTRMGAKGDNCEGIDPT